jgi:membrane protein YdbS with pleckstrin-like domain
MIDRMDTRERTSHPPERLLFTSRPRFLVYLKSSLIKFIFLLLVLYFFSYILSRAIQLQNYLINYVRLPLVEGTTYLLLILILILILWILWSVISWRYTKYMLTNHRVMVQKGIIRKKKTYIHFNKIHDIIISQGIMERLVSSGDIKIYSGHENTELILEDVPNPVEVEDMINRLIEGEHIGFKKYAPSTKRKSIIEEYDQKFKRL